MKFVKTYQETSFDRCYKPYYYVDNKRVNAEKFEFLETKCRIMGMFYNCPTLTTQKNNRYKATYYYNEYCIEK